MNPYYKMILDTLVGCPEFCVDGGQFGNAAFEGTTI